MNKAEQVFEKLSGLQAQYYKLLKPHALRAMNIRSPKEAINFLRSTETAKLEKMEKVLSNKLKNASKKKPLSSVQDLADKGPKNFNRLVNKLEKM